METDSDDEPDVMNIVPQLAIILVLTLINAFFSSAELAVLSANRNKIKYLAENGNKRANLVLKLVEEETKFLSTIQVAITLAGFFSSATAASNISGLLGNYLVKFNIPYANTIALILITLILSYFTLVFGELFPKRVALRMPEKIAMLSAGPINIVKKIFRPIVGLLTLSSNLLVKITGLEKGLVDDRVSEDEIISIIESGVSDGSIHEEEQQMIESVFKFNDLEAMDVMTPRVDVFMIDIDDPMESFINKIVEGKYTRIPVYQDSKDNIIGIIHIRDFLKQVKKVGFENINIPSIIRKPLFATDNIKINSLFKKMKASKNHIAILYDQYGGFVGIVTLEDLVEEIMGDIVDEYDDNYEPIVKIKNNEYLIDASVAIQDLNKALNLDFDEDNENYDTLGGLLLLLLDRVPEENETATIDYENITFIITKMDVNRIEKVKMIINK